MKLTHKTEYALLALMYLSRIPEDQTAQAKHIAEAQEIPMKFLQQIFSQLRQARYVATERGKEGGYRLAKKPSEITLAEIVRLFDGALAPTVAASTYFYSTSPIQKEQKTLAVLKEVRDLIATKLENTTLEMLI